jgi:hypothetical protein
VARLIKASGSMLAAHDGNILLGDALDRIQSLRPIRGRQCLTALKIKESHAKAPTDTRRGTRENRRELPVG